MLLLNAELMCVCDVVKKFSRNYMLQTFSSDGTVSLSLQISLETCWWDNVRNSSHSTTSLQITEQSKLQ